MEIAVELGIPADQKTCPGCANIWYSSDGLCKIGYQISDTHPFSRPAACMAAARKQAALESTQLDFSLPPQGYAVFPTYEGSPDWYWQKHNGDWDGAPHTFPSFKNAVRAAWEHEGTHWAAYQEWEKSNAGK